MQPPSILRFSRFFLISLGLAAALTVMTFDSLKASLIRQDPAAASLGDGVLGMSIALGLGVMVVLWYLIARRGSNIAKWVLVALTAVSIFLQLPKLGAVAANLDLVAVLSLLAAAGQIYAIAMLFRADARAWLGREEPVSGLDIG